MSNYSPDFAPPTGTSNRRPYTTPVLEELQPGTPRYEAARAAFARLNVQDKRASG